MLTWPRLVTTMVFVTLDLGNDNGGADQGGWIENSVCAHDNATGTYAGCIIGYFFWYEKNHSRRIAKLNGDRDEYYTILPRTEKTMD